MDRFPAKVTYGIMATIELACHDRTIPLQAKTIAKRQGIPSRFIEQILQQLKQAGIIRSLRGAQGGYTLVPNPQDLSLAELVNSIKGIDPTSPTVNRSTEHPENSQVSSALLSQIWAQVQEAEQAVLRMISLQSLVEQYQTLEPKGSLMYHI